MSFYVDSNASYPVEPSHYDDVAALLKEVDGNPSSIHATGRGAKVALENARTRVAAMLGVRATEIVFTSGATEANNMVIQGVIGREFLKGAKPHVIIGATEHSSVKEPVRVLEERGACRVSVAPVHKDGTVDELALLELVSFDTALVCVMHANNETGAINPIVKLVERIKAKNNAVHIHVDAVQMFGKFDLTSYASLKIDSAAISAHKVGGFKGVGALFLKSGVKFNALSAGGGQERARRPGTENMPGILSMGLRCEELKGKESGWVIPMQALKAAWVESLGTIPGAVLHGNPEKTLPNTVNFHVDGVMGDDILLNFDLAGIEVSSGSACSSGSARPSHVLMAMGYDDWVALNSIRVSFSGRGCAGDVQHMTKVLKETVMRVQNPGAGKVRGL